MKATHSLTSVLALASLALSAPLLHKRATTPTEMQILNFALTLEHLENAFYSTFLEKFDEDDFTKAGYQPFVRGRMLQLASHEAQHQAYLEAALGANATKPCTYDFPVTSVAEFVATSQVLEGVGVTAYLGAMQFLHDPSYIIAAGSILTMEARHNAWLNSAAMSSYPWSDAFDSAQSLDAVFSLAAPMIKSCPSTNPTLPATAFPALNASTTSFPIDASSAGKTMTLSYSGSTPSGQNLVLLHGSQTSSVPISDGKVSLPSGLQGTVYAVVSKDQTSNDASVVAGPIILTFPFSSGELN